MAQAFRASWGWLEAEKAHGRKCEGHACHLAAGGAFVEKQGGQQNGAGRVKRTDHGGDVEAAEPGGEDVEEIAEGVERAGEGSDKPESLPRARRRDNGDHEEQGRHSRDSG